MHSLSLPHPASFEVQQDKRRLALLGLASLLVSVAAWHPQLGHEWLVLAGLIPVLWARANNRVETVFAIAPYFLYATRDVPDLLQSFTQASAVLCFVITLVYCAAITTLWVFSWQPAFAKRIIGLAVVSTLTLLPPFGSLFVASPMLASGLLFPATGLLGMVSLFASWVAVDACCQRDIRIRIALAGSACLALVILATQLLQAHAESSSRVVPINTYMSQYPAPHDVQGRYARQLELIALIEKLSMAHPDNTIFVLPESIAGRQEARFEWLWADAAKTLKSRSQSLVYGIETVNADGLANSAMMIGKYTRTRRFVATLEI